MSPELKIRDLSPETLARLQGRARVNHRSVEAELRFILADALSGEAVSAEAWESSGFTQVDEVIPGRIYDAWGDGRHFRIYVSRGIVSSNTIRWHSAIDEAVYLDGDVKVWISPVGIPQRLWGDTPEIALADAIRWLSDWARIDAKGRVLRDAEAAEHMEPALCQVADAVTEVFGDTATSTWRDDMRASWSTDTLDFFISRDGDKVALFTYQAGTMTLAFAPTRFQFVTDVARRIVDTMHQHLRGKGDPVRRATGTRIQRD